MSTPSEKLNRIKTLKVICTELYKHLQYNGIRTHDFCDIGAVLVRLPTEQSSQLGAGNRASS